MPHDLNGKKLKVGDTVHVPCVIQSISESEEFCNLTLETTERMFPGEHKSGITVNGKQVVLQEPTG